MFTRLCLPVVACLSAVPSLAAQRIPGIGPTGPLRQIDSGFIFTEGPAQDAAGNLYFSDVPGNQLYRIDTNRNRTTFLSPSGNGNGIFFDRLDRMLVCQHAGRVVEVNKTTKAITVLAGQFNGRRFNSPNDLVPDVYGGFYFTDPTFGGNHQDKQGVYYRAASGTVTRLVDNLTLPNGIVLSPGEDTLYVASTTPSAILSYPVLGPGRIGPARQWFALGGSSVDGMTVDTKGNVFLTRPGLSAIEVVTPAGTSLGRFAVPQRPSNCAFGGPNMKTLFITARDKIYEASMESTGFRQPRMTATTDRIPVGGGSVRFDIRTSTFHAGQAYVILAGSSGSTPGLAVERVRIPINLDAFTTLALTLTNSVIFQNSFGFLDTNGAASAAFNLPPSDPSLIGAKWNFATVLVSPIAGASNSHQVEITR